MRFGEAEAAVESVPVVVLAEAAEPTIRNGLSSLTLAQRKV